MTRIGDILSSSSYIETSITTSDPSKLQLMVILDGADPLDCLQLLSVDLCGVDPLEASTPMIWMSLWSSLTHSTI